MNTLLRYFFLVALSVLLFAWNAHAKTLFLCDDREPLLLTDDASLGCPVYTPKADVITVPDGATWSDVEWAVAIKQAEQLPPQLPPTPSETAPSANIETSPMSTSPFSPPPPAADTIVLELDGYGHTSTQAFTVDGDWGIEWEATDQFQLLAYTVTTKDPSYEDTMRAVSPQVLANKTEGGAGSSYIGKGGSYRFTINAAGAWHIRVVDLAPVE